MEVKQIGNLWGEDTEFDNKTSGRVYDKDGISPTLNTMQGGWKQPMIIDALNTMPDGTCRTIKSQYGNTSSANFEYSSTFGATGVIVAMRGRNPENPSDRTVGAPTEQRLEPNSQGLCNTLTSVQKDNLVMETVKIKQATKEGYIDCKVGGVSDLSFPDSATRRVRVQDSGDICPTFMAGEQDICRIENVYDFYNNSMKSDGICGTLTSACSHNGSGTFRVVEGEILQTPRGYNNGGKFEICPSITSHSFQENNFLNHQYRIRKLIPLECWRLMDFTDEDFSKAAEVNSNTQLYKQAGNSIVKNVLVAIIGQMIPGKENYYKETE